MAKNSYHRKSIKEWMKKTYQDGVSNSVFLAIYEDRLNWCLHEDAPWKDTIETEADQTYQEYKKTGIPNFVLDLLIDEERDNLKNHIDEILK